MYAQHPDRVIRTFRQRLPLTYLMERMNSSLRLEPVLRHPLLNLIRLHSWSMTLRLEHNQQDLLCLVTVPVEAETSREPAGKAGRNARGDGALSEVSHAPLDVRND